MEFTKYHYQYLLFRQLHHRQDYNTETARSTMFCCLSGSPSSTRHKYHDDRCSPSTLFGSPSSNTDDMYHNRCLGFRQVPIRPVYNYRRPEDLDSSSTSPKRTCTTTSTTTFPRTSSSLNGIDPFQKCTFRRYNRRDDARERMIVMYELHVFEPCPNWSLHVPRLPCRRSVGTR